MRGARTGRATEWTAAHRAAHFGAIGRGAVRIEAVRISLTMMVEALG